MKALPREGRRLYVALVGAVLVVAAQQGVVIASGLGKTAIALVIAEDALIVGLMFLRRLDLLYAGLVFFLPFGAILQLGKGGAGHTLLPVFGAVVAGVWLTTMLTHHHPIAKAPELKWLGAFVIVVWLSALASTKTPATLTDVQSLTFFVVLAFLTVQIVRSWQQLTMIGWVLIVALSIVGGLTVLSATAGLTISGVLAPIQDTSQFGTLARYGSVSGGGANDTGLLMAIGLLLCLGYLRMYRRQTTVVVLLLACGALLVAGEILSYSLGGVLGAIVGIFIVVPKLSRSSMVRLGKQVVLAVLATLFVLSPLTGLQQRTNEQLYVTSTQSSSHWGSQRVGLWAAAFDVTLHWPVLGVGPGNGAYFIPRYWSQQYLNPMVLVRDGHNLYLDVGADMGIPGLALILILTIWPAVKLRRLLRGREGPEVALIQTFFGCLVALNVIGMSNGLYLYAELWLLIGLAVAISRICRLEGANEPNSSAVPVEVDIRRRPGVLDSAGGSTG